MRAFLFVMLGCKYAAFQNSTADSKFTPPLRWWYIDADGDGYGGRFRVRRTHPPLGFVDNNNDCNDTAAASVPGSVYLDATDSTYSGIQDAVDASGYGDTIHICRFEDVSGVSLYNKEDITLYGYGNSSVHTPYRSCLMIEESLDVMVVGLNLLNCIVPNGVTSPSGASTVDGGGGLWVNNSGNIYLSDLTISGNSASGKGGGIYIDGMTGGFSSVVISGNSAGDDGGGIYIDGDSQVDFEGGSITDHLDHHGVYINDDGVDPIIVQFANVGLTANLVADIQFSTGNAYTYNSIVSLACDSASGSCL